MTVVLHARRLADLSATVTAGAVAASRPWLRSGSTHAERLAELPGDDVLAGTRLVATRGVTIGARPGAVWPWLAQMGHGRGGWRGYDLWDNAGQASADRPIPELQDPAVGDVIADAVGPFGFHVATVEPGRAIVLRATIHPVTGKPADPVRDPERPFLDFTWAFVLVPEGADRTRLIVRVRYDHSRHWWVARAVDACELVDAVFSRRMLAGIRQRVERGDDAATVGVAAGDVTGRGDRVATA